MLVNNLNKLSTKINISYNRFNINNLVYTDSEVSKLTKIEKKINIRPHNEVPKEFRFSIINIPKYTVVFIIDNEASLFSMNTYLDLLINSNINLVISSTNKFRKYIKKFYKNIYDPEKKYDFMLFTNKLFKNIPLKSVDIKKCYILDNKYDIKDKFNCFYINNKSDLIKIDMEEYEYLKFTSSSIDWFISKIFSNSIHKYNPSNIIICTKNTSYLRGCQYIYIDQNLMNYFELYYNWFNFSFSNYNIQFVEFILLVIGYYLSKLTIFSNVFINSFVNNNSDQTIGLKKDNILKGIQIRDKNIGDFFDFLKLVTNKFGEINISIDKSTKIQHIALIKDYTKELNIDNILVKALEHDINDVESIKMSYPYLNIWIFNSFKDFKYLNKDLDKFPDKNFKIISQNIEFYKIYNSYHSNTYNTISFNEYVLDFRDFKDKNIDKIFSSISSYNNTVLVTILLDRNNNYNYFKYYYNNLGYKIIFIDLFGINDDDSLTDSNNIIVKYTDDIFNNKKEFTFIKPNFYYDVINSSYKGYRCRYFKDIDKSDINLGIISYTKNKDFNKMYIVDIEISIIQRILLNKFYNSILNNEYLGLFNN